MSRVDELLHAFVSEFREVGDADPRPYLRELAGTDRAELAALIDHFLATEPPPPFDAEAFASFRAAPARDALVSDLLGDGPAIAELRHAAGLTKAQVGARLAAELGFAGQENAAKAAYHDIESGQVAPERVRSRIWDALSKLFDVSAEHVSRAARAAFDARPPVAPAAPALFMRAGAAAAAPAEEPARDAAVRQAFFVD